VDISNLVGLKGGKGRDEHPTEEELRQLRQRVAEPKQEQVATERKWARRGTLEQSFEELRRSLKGTIHALVLAVEMKDPYTAGHQRWVAGLACAIAREMSLSGEKIEGIRMAGLVHDIGKLSVPAEILSKPSQLTGTEFDLLKAHPQVAYDILKAIDFPWPVAEIVLQHHERMDGSGYPQGLKGDDILFEARILAVADVVEAMLSHRPYRPALGIDKAMEEIRKNKGKLYDQDVVAACRGYAAKNQGPKVFHHRERSEDVVKQLNGEAKWRKYHFQRGLI